VNGIGDLVIGDLVIGKLSIVDCRLLIADC
jgi:hypothetical protein